MPREVEADEDAPSARVALPDKRARGTGSDEDAASVDDGGEPRG